MTAASNLPFRNSSYGLPSSGLDWSDVSSAFCFSILLLDTRLVTSLSCKFRSSRSLSSDVIHLSLVQPMILQEA